MSRLNPDNMRVFLRFAACIVVGAALSLVFGLFVPHFRGWQAIGPGALMLLVCIFVIPESMRKRP